jgi:hypothetical protein
MKTFTARQGDVLIRTIGKLPKGLARVPLDGGRVILAYGEVTGHAHVVEGDVQLFASDLEEMEQRFLRVEEEAQVVHDEHDTVTLPPGDYEIVRQREYTSADMAPVRVAD